MSFVQGHRLDRSTWYINKGLHEYNAFMRGNCIVRYVFIIDKYKSFTERYTTRDCNISTSILIHKLCLYQLIYSVRDIRKAY